MTSAQAYHFRVRSRKFLAETSWKARSRLLFLGIVRHRAGEEIRSPSKVKPSEKVQLDRTVRRLLSDALSPIRIRLECRQAESYQKF